MIKRYREFYFAVLISLFAAAAGFIVLLKINLTAAVIFIFACLAVFLPFFTVTFLRARDIRALSDYLNHINNGEFDLDITDNKEGEMSILKNNIYKVVVTLRAQQELLLKDKIYLADSLADISHQLKTPITSITVMTDLIKNETDEKKRREFLDIINSQLSRMNWLTVTLLKLSKIDAGAVEFKNEMVNLKKIIENAVKPFYINAEVKGIELTEECDENISVCVDANWYSEALSNIVKNCVEHTDSGYVKVSAFTAPMFTKIVIEDSGAGISKEDLPHIFERFYQCGRRSETSVGIGLALSKAIFSRQNSSVFVSSAENEGTRFEITLYKTVI